MCSLQMRMPSRNTTSKKAMVHPKNGVDGGVEVDQILLPTSLLRLVLSTTGATAPATTAATVLPPELHDGLAALVCELAGEVSVRITAVVNRVHTSKIKILAHDLSFTGIRPTQQRRLVISPRTVSYMVTPKPACNAVSYITLILSRLAVSSPWLYQDTQLSLHLLS